MRAAVARSLVAQRVCFETIGLPQRRRRLESMAGARREGKRQNHRTSESRVLWGSRSVVESVRPSAWGFGSRAARSISATQELPRTLPSIGHLGPSARRSKFDSRFFIILIKKANFRGATRRGYTAIRCSKSEEIIDGRRRELRARAGAGPCRRARTPDGRAGPDRALRREDCPNTRDA